MDEPTKSLLDNLEFDKDAAWNEYIRFRAQKAAITYLARRFSMPSISYATVESSVESVVASLCERLNVDPAELAGGSASVPVPTRAGSSSYEAFSKALDDLLHHQRDEVEPRTIKTLQNLVGADLRMAKTLARAVPG